MSLEDLIVDNPGDVGGGGEPAQDQQPEGDTGAGDESKGGNNPPPELEQALREAEQYRQLSDRLLGLVGKPQQGGVSEKDNEALIEEFEKDPQAFIAKVARDAVKNLPDIQKTKETLDEIAAKEARSTLASEVEDYEAVLTSDGFKAYIQGNPTLGRFLVEANEANDAATVASILKAYKATQGATGSGGDKGKRDPANSSRSTGGTAGGKIFSREAIKKLIVENPQEYARLQGEIDLAYKEGRVK